MRLCDEFPGDVARGGDITSGMSTPRAEFEPVHSDRWGTVYRRERVVALGVWVEELVKPEGEVCLLESTVRALGELIGLVPGEQLIDAQLLIMGMGQEIADLQQKLTEHAMVETVVKRAVDSALAELVPQLAGLEEEVEQGKAPPRKRAVKP